MATNTDTPMPVPQRSKGRRGLVLLGIAITVLAVGLVVRWPDSTHTVTGVEVSLRAAAVVPGTSAERVVVVLDSLKAEHSPLEPGRVTINAILGRSFTDLLMRG